MEEGQGRQADADGVAQRMSMFHAPIAPYPPELAKAMAAVMADIPKIKFDARNNHQNYSYASVDAIFAAVRPVMAKHGVSLHMTEAGYEFNGDFLVVDYDGHFVHEGGCSPVIKQRAIVRTSMGSQAYGAAQSYAGKMLLRRAFLLETGDGDSDASEQSAPTKTKTEVKKPRPLTKKGALQADMTKMGLTKPQMKALSISLTGKCPADEAGVETMARFIENATLDQVLQAIEEHSNGPDNS